MICQMNIWFVPDVGEVDFCLSITTIWKEYVLDVMGIALFEKLQHQNKHKKLGVLTGFFQTEKDDGLGKNLGNHSLFVLLLLLERPPKT